MTVIEKSALVRYPAHRMLQLVEDIESYPLFLPWCHASRILRRTDDTVEAELEIMRGGFRKSFATRNQRVSSQEIRMSLIKGPFSRLEGVWTFVPLREDASKIALHLEFEMMGKLSNLAFGAVFNQICNSMVGAFTQRAKDLYG
jgi:ribosome-associated toxin RatA of RatAB toxin-antitoxin module